MRKHLRSLTADGVSLVLLTTVPESFPQLRELRLRNGIMLLTDAQVAAFQRLAAQLEVRPLRNAAPLCGSDAAFDEHAHMHAGCKSLT